MQVGADLSGLASSLRKPLRCLWVTQDGAEWEQGGAGTVDVAALPFTPIVLVGASATTARQRRTLTLPGGELVVARCL